MTDLEIVKLCAEAMEIEHRCVDNVYVECRPEPPKDPRWWDEYRPLHDDAQAMALVKRFGINISYQVPFVRVWIPMHESNPNAWVKDLNRAICEAVAKMQKAKT